MAKKTRNKLRVMMLGGLNEIGKNIAVIEYGANILVVDCGLAFPEGLETIGASHATAKREIKLDTALRGIQGTSVKLHPGAEKFYKEKGILK